MSAPLENAVAIVGMAVRTAGAADLGEFWELRREGLWQGRRHSEAELDAASVPRAVRDHPDYVPVSAPLDGFDRFDGEFFGITPRDAALYDPQFRVLLEVAWHGFEDAGIDPATFGGRVGVVVGSGTNGYLWTNVLPTIAQSVQAEQADAMQVRMSNDKDFLATLLSYKLDLQGPAVTVQTACSTSLVAVHQGVQDLIAFEADLVVAGGVCVNLPHDMGQIHQPGGIMSADGRCRPFSADADGTFAGSGAGVVLLRRLKDALADGDPIHAVIRGSAVNNDGGRKVGYTAPSVDGQVTVLTEALAVAGVAPESVELIETHGTATRLGDLVEFDALRTAYDAPGAAVCALGTLKASVGHLDAAAGVVGLIGTALCLEHGVLPASPWFTGPNPLLGLEETRFELPTAPVTWSAGPSAAPRRAAVSSLGIGGTNAHMVLEQAPATGAAVGEPSGGVPQVLLLSARGPAALGALATRYADRVEAAGDAALARLAAESRDARRGFAWRGSVVAATAADAAAAARSLAQARPPVAPSRPRDGLVAFLLPGQGTQHPGMASALYHASPRYRELFDECADLLGHNLGDGARGIDLRDVVFGPTAGELLARTEYAQPALFAVEHSLARLWADLGVTPGAMLGHSLGEYVAACLAGVFALEDGLRLVALRGRLMQGLPRGAMAAIRAPEGIVRAALPDAVDVAALNGPGQTVVAGAPEDVERFAARMRAGGITVDSLSSSIAFHSRAVEPVLDAFGAAVARTPLHAPELPFLSNETGTWADPAAVATAEYWLRHTRSTVRFAEGVATLVREPDRVLLEVGPGRTLTSLTRRRLRTSAQLARVTLSPPDPEDPADGSANDLAAAAAALWSAGVAIRWDTLPGLLTRAGALGGAPGARLPSYPFGGERAYLPFHAAEVPASGAGAGAQSAGVGAPTADGEAVPAPTSGGSGEVLATVLDVWRDVFGVEAIEDDDDFFDLGGTSLAAAQVVTRLRCELDVALPVSTIFTATTPIALAEALAAPLATVPAQAAQPVGGTADGLDGLEEAAVQSLTMEELDDLERLLEVDAGAGGGTR